MKTLTVNETECTTLNNNVVREVQFQEWESFQKDYPFHLFNGNMKEFEYDCVEHTAPGFTTTIGCFIDGKLSGLLSYQTMYFLNKETTADDGVIHVNRSLITTPEEGRVPLFYVYSMVTHPDYRRKGVASAMIDYLEQKKSIEEYILMYPVSSMCQSLSEKLGFDFNTPVWINQEDVAKKI